MNLKFFYSMKIEFSSPVIRHCYSLRCLPFDNDFQRIGKMQIQVEPHNLITETADGFGNRVLTDRILEPHTEFIVVAEGTAEVDYAKRACEALNSIYKYSSQYTKAGVDVTALTQHLPAFTPDASPVAYAMLVSEEIQKRLSYKSGVTNIHTTAQEALEMKCGVCQDYAHVMIAVCRAAGLPARYVAGILKGTGESHAWVEIYQDGMWIGIDPTNQRVCDETYLQLSHGRDFADCGLNRGLFIGGGTQTQTVVARVEVI